MGRKFEWLGLVALLAFDARAAQAPSPEAGMSEDARRMHERLVALSKGEDSPSELRIEFMDGSMSAHRSFNLEAGYLVSKEWKSPGAPMIHREGTVSDSRVSELLQQLIAKQYWRFQGTRFVPDAPMFLFRFYYGDLKAVDFRCDADEFQESQARGAVRELFLKFASETEMQNVPVKSGGLEP